MLFPEGCMLSPPPSRAISVGDLGGYLDEWRTYLESENKAARTAERLRLGDEI